MKTRRGKDAERSIEALFSDTSVSPQTTADELADLRSNIDIKLECLAADRKTEAGNRWRAKRESTNG